jgi:hypothetical protein
MQLADVPLKHFHKGMFINFSKLRCERIRSHSQSWNFLISHCYVGMHENDFQVKMRIWKHFENEN